MAGREGALRKSYPDRVSTGNVDRVAPQRLIEPAELLLAWRQTDEHLLLSPLPQCPDFARKAPTRRTWRRAA